jgi:soluble lytic murein transglycosylase
VRQADSPLWPVVLAAIEAMSPEMQRDTTWVFWQARTLLALHTRNDDPDVIKARAMLQRIAGIDGFYEQLALHALGQAVTIPPRPASPTQDQMNQVRNNPSLKRALLAIQMGLRGPGVREWNYGTSLVDAEGKPGKLSPELMHAAAFLAYENQVWDRSIFTSERASVLDVELRFPRPYLNDVMDRCREIGLDPAVVYGLIRQESRFIMNARSSVGAAGLMQVMPATARWTAKRLGMSNFQVDQLGRHDVNIQIGTGFLKIVLNHFQGQLPLTAAAYNAGPGRARKWRQGPVLDGAIWAENIPFNETRDYVKKVVANANVYGALISGTPQRVVDRLGTIGPAPNSSDEGSDIP